MAIEPVRDFPARGLPYSLVRKHMLQRLVQILDAERQPNHERMQRNAHHPPALFSFPIKRVELVTKHLAVFGGGVVATHEHTDMVRGLFESRKLAHFA